jgi:putative peptide zinc metalloprotease protein
MLCSVCRRQVSRDAARCRACGTPVDAPEHRRHLDLVLPGGERAPLDRSLVIGRAAASDLRLPDESVSRVHARIEVNAGGATLEDLDSSYGTFLDGRQIEQPAPLRAGMRIEIGDCRLEVADRLDRAQAGHTLSVPAGMSLIVEQPRVRRARLGGHAARRPRLRSGWSIKRLDAAEGEHRWILKDHRSAGFMRLAGPEAELVQLLDGSRELIDLVGEANARCGSDGPGRLARLLAELADRGLLVGVERGPEERPALPPWLTRLLRPRERELPGVPERIAAVYRHGGFVLFTPVAMALLAAIAVAGVLAFAVLIAGRDGTPLVVARRVGLGAVVFVLGRLALVICHELAHGLIAESFGRPVSRAGVKLVLVFPYVFVDTTDAWFESRRRRMMISLAGPACDLALGGACAVACWLAGPGSARDVLFQLAFGGYVGALLNLNPLLERDGYHVLVDLLGEPGLRRRASRRLAEAISGRSVHSGAGGATDRRLLGYGVAGLAWSAITIAFAVVLSLRYYHRLASLAPPALVWTVLAGFYLLLALPLALALLRPLWIRVARPSPGVAGP